MTSVNADNMERGWLHPAQGREDAVYWRWLRAMASPRLTLFVFGLVGAGAVWSYSSTGGNTWPLVGPLALFGLNLMAAVAVHPGFQRQPALLVSHIALLAVVILVALGRLTYLKGHVELSQGERFSGKLAGYQAGPWHPWGLGKVRFVNEGFTIAYQPGRRRDHTFNRVRVMEDNGGSRELIIGDQVPIVVEGYRFYTSFNKGFALTFTWTPRQGPPTRGTVHLPAYPIHEYRQANTWTPPGATKELWVQLQFDEPLLDPGGPARFRTPGSHLVVVRTGERRVELAPGREIEFAEGRLIYEGVRTWMGYRVFYDWTIPWLLAACLVAVGSLGWHFWRKTARRPWQAGLSEGSAS